MSLNNGKIAVLMPTRGDPELFAHAVSTMESTQSGFADLFFYVADDDPRLDDYHKLVPHLPKWCHPSFGMPLGFSKGVNLLAAHAMEWDEYAMLMRGEDDFEYQGNGWDRV